KRWSFPPGDARFGVEYGGSARGPARITKRFIASAARDERQRLPEWHERRQCREDEHKRRSKLGTRHHITLGKCVENGHPGWQQAKPRDRCFASGFVSRTIKEV